MNFIASLDTDVAVSRSVAQIQKLVERFDAREFRLIYGTGSRPAAVRFVITDPHLVAGADLFTVELAAPADVLVSLIQQHRKTWNDAHCVEQAERVAWRQLHDYVRAALISVQWGIVTVGEAFLAGLVVTGPSGEEKRLGQLIFERGLLRPAAGKLLLRSGE